MKMKRLLVIMLSAIIVVNSTILTFAMETGKGIEYELEEEAEKLLEPVPYEEGTEKFAQEVENEIIVEQPTSPPMKSIIEVSKEVYQIGEEIVFTFSSDYATEYYIWIADTDGWEKVVKGSNEGNCYSTSNTFSISTLPPGTYYAVM